MSLYEIQGTYTSGTNFTATLHNTELNAIRTAVNNIQNVNIAADAAIAMSKLADFLSWTDWTPTYSTNGSMTWGTITTSIARYTQIGKIVFFQIKALGTVGGTPDIQLRFTLPVASLNTGADLISVNCTAIDGYGNYRSGFALSSGTADVIAVNKFDGNVWGAGAGRGFTASGFYELP